MLEMCTLSTDTCSIHITEVGDVYTVHRRVLCASRSESYQCDEDLKEIDISKLVFLFKKQLKNSDVGVLRRIVLPKKESETNLPILESKEGIPITMLDMDGIHQWSFKYRYCPNNNSRMYVLEYTGEFVHEHKLTVNDSIIVYHNIYDGKYIIEGRKTMLVRSTPMWGRASYKMS
ncbi:hypothetical protein ACS0TY_004765 [Phlomoides rotata]